jgi:hypothetical protein
MTDQTEPNKEEKLNIVDTASLTFFTNPAYYGILQRKKLCNIKDNSAEIKFYRKRIISLFKDMLKGEEEPVNKEIKEIHTMFVNSAIRYFEVTDKKDIVQGQHANAIDTNAIDTNAIDTNAIDTNSIDAINTNDTIEETPEEILNAIGGPEIYSLAEANDKMMRKNIAVASLDNYVIKDTPVNEVRIIPMKMEINLKATGLKEKGVPPKKSKNKKEDLSN